MASPPIKKTEPISILKAPPPLSPLSYANTSTMVRNEPIILSDDEDEDPRNMISDEDEDPALIPSEKTLELLQTEKVCHSGYLLKKGEKRRTWKKRWFVLRTTKLAMYKDKKEYKLLRIIDLHDILSVIQVTSKNKYRYVFAIYTPKRTYYVQAEDQLTMKDWLEAIEQAKGELKQYDANDNSNLVGQQLQEQDISKDIVHSYKSTASNLSNSTTNNAITSYSQQRRPSGSSSSSGILADTRRPSNGLMHASSSPSTAFSSNNNNIQPTSSNNMKSDKTSKNLRINVSPIDLPKPQVTFSSTPIHDDSANPIYPVSPTFDQYQAHTNEGIASSDDDEEYSAANSIIDIKKEEDRNRVLVEGYLLKLGRNKGWQKRWFVLRTDTLAYYEDDKEYSPHRIIPLSHIKNSLQIEPMSKNKQYCFKISIPKRQYVLCASTENDMKSWLNALNIAVKQLNNNETSTNLSSSSSSSQAQTSISPSDKSTKPNHHHSRFPHLPHPHLPHLHHPQQQQQQQHQQQQQALRLEQIPEMERSTSQMARKISLDSFENVSHISGVSGAGAVGGAGGALGRR
ncbi:hypothetical protein BJ944DRAFT_262143 [Cunninghamella echinulata]|nr:hypothetical protein BJ944DRAFT_262143 [Cunninghamella echinulata]